MSEVIATREPTTVYGGCMQFPVNDPVTAATGGTRTLLQCPVSAVTPREKWTLQEKSNQPDKS